MPPPPSGSSPRPHSPRPRPLGGLAAVLGAATWLGPPAAATEVSGVTLDSRAVRPGDLYAALAGTRTHGARFVEAVAAAGAVAVLTDPEGADRAVATGLPVVVVADPRAVLGAVAVWAFDDPGRDLTLLGVTGTNGKTTTTYLLEAGLRAAGHRTGLIGTIETRIGDSVLPSARTTPEAPEVQALFAVMRERGVTAAAMEVSSHALALGRVDGVRFDVAVFTNLSQDHLDFHRDMEDYFAAKARLFTAARAARAVISLDDGYGERLHAGTEVPVTTYATRPGVAADWTVTDVEPGPDRTTFRVRGPGGVDVPAAVRLPGLVNVANALGAIAALDATGVPLGAALRGVAELTGVPGRLERVEAGQPFLAVVDYAHTPQAVATVLAAVRPIIHPGGRLIVVLGCGGDRDPGKRPAMGAAAASGADLAVLTNDNPRSEDPLAILAALRAGTREVPPPSRAEVLVEPDRAAAIALAVDRARPGDAVVVAGKGHETGQEVNGVVTPFDDRAVLRAALAARPTAGTAAGGAR